MRTVVSWNCNMAFRNKQSQILRHDPDILVVQECESPAVAGDWANFSDWMWVGENEHKGLGIFTRNGYSLTPGPLTRIGGQLSVPVTSDAGVDILGVWAMNDEQQPAHRYVAQVYRTVRAYHDWIDSETIVVGDFNWNKQWDESPNSPLAGDLTETVQLLHDRGLQSAYHSSNSCGFGDEPDSTFYMHKKQDRPYHIDYVFVPRDREIARLTVGEYDDWIDASDHMPLVVDVASV